LSGNYQSVMRERSSSRALAISSVSRATPFRVFFALPIMNGDRLVGVVYLSRTPREIVQALFYHERRNVVLAAVLSLGLAALVSLIVSLMIVTPVKRLASEAKVVAEGHKQGFEARSSFIAVRELAELRTVVADMAERLHRRSDYLKAFASGVSHEFKTPLTAIKGAMELLGEHGRDMDQDTRDRFENNIKADLDRLERLVTRLLALARAEARTEADGDRTEAKELAERLADHYRGLGFSLEIEAPPGLLELSVSQDALETVLRNLLDNSQMAGATRSEIELGFDGFQRFGVIKISDNGPGIPEDAAESIFKPFFTTRKNAGGTGLGLSLARTLLAPYRGELSFLGNAPGAVFSITLPLASAKPEEPGDHAWK
jgi:Signal transduction histidine kinase